jgi:ABC-type nitrate/sulfonate/bicarbonate transport system substrate-binding protein
MSIKLRCAAALAFAVLTLRPAPVPAAEPIPFKIGISEAVNTVLAIWVAEEAGFYAEAGLRPEIINMSGGSRGAAALAAGQIDAMHVGLSSVIRMNRTGGDLRIVASLANVIRFTFFSAPGVRTAADLQGGVVGISSFGSETDSTVTLALARLGLTRNDVTLKEFGGGPRRIAALKAGEIKATAVNEPMTSLAREQGLHVLFDLVPERIPWLFTAIVVRQRSIAEQRDLLARFIKATAEGNLLALTDAARVKAVLAKRANINDPKILEISYEDFRQLSPPLIEPTDDAARTILAQFPEVSQSVGDYLDRNILDGLKRDGVFVALQQKYRR